MEGLKQLFQGWEVVVMSNDDKGSYPMIDFDKVNKCDLFVLGGGELINRSCLFMQSPNIFSNSAFYKIYGRTPFGKYSWVHRIKIPKVILGCGVNAKSPFELSRWNVNGLQQFDYIGLRDNVSVNILRSFPQLRSKVDLFYDLAFSIDTNVCWRNSRSLAVVIPTDRFHFGDSGVRENHVAVKSASWLKEKLRGYGKTVFLAFGEQDNDDYETCKVLSNCASNSEILRYNELTTAKVLGLLSVASMVISYRLHGLILSHIVGVPCEFYPYHWKLQRVYDAIKSVSPEYIRLKQNIIIETLA